MLEYGFYLGRENQPAAGQRVVERFDADAIASEYNSTRGFVPQRDREIAFKLIDEYWWMTRGTNSFSIVDADRAFWDYNPVMLNSTIVNLSKAGNYHFYQWQNEPGTSNNFGGAAQMMKNYIRYRTTNATFSLDTISRRTA